MQHIHLLPEFRQELLFFGPFSRHSQMLHESHIEQILDHTHNLVPYCVFAHLLVRAQAVDPRSHLLINFKYAEKCSEKFFIK